MKDKLSFIILLITIISCTKKQDNPQPINNTIIQPLITKIDTSTYLELYVNRSNKYHLAASKYKNITIDTIGAYYTLTNDSIYFGFTNDYDIRKNNNSPFFDTKTDEYWSYSNTNQQKGMKIDSVLYTQLIYSVLYKLCVGTFQTTLDDLDNKNFVVVNIKFKLWLRFKDS